MEDQREKGTQIVRLSCLAIGQLQMRALRVGFDAGDRTAKRVVNGKFLVLGGLLPAESEIFARFRCAESGLSAGLPIFQAGDDLISLGR